MASKIYLAWRVCGGKRELVGMYDTPIQAVIYKDMNGTGFETDVMQVIRFLTQAAIVVGVTNVYRNQ